MMHAYGCTCDVCVLSRKLTEKVGIRLRVLQRAGVLNDGQTEFHWWKCPIHDTWLQPEIKPHAHWKCKAQGCEFKRAAKMRTSLEIRIFKLYVSLEENA